MPKRPNQTNNTFTACKKAKTCLVMHAETLAVLERIEEQLSLAIAALQGLIEDADTQEIEEETD